MYANPEDQRKWQREYQRRLFKSNPEKKRARDRRYYHANKNLFLIYRREHIDQIRAANRKRYERDPIPTMMRLAIRSMFRSEGNRGHSVEYIGCSPGFLRNHLESLFQEGMTWENYGEWQVDHIVPVSWFPFDKDPELLFVASHWTNLQPMWGKENSSKGNHRSS